MSKQYLTFFLQFCTLITCKADVLSTGESIDKEYRKQMQVKILSYRTNNLIYISKLLKKVLVLFDCNIEHLFL